MIIFSIMSIGAWTGFGYCLGTGNRVGEIVFPILAVLVGVISAAFDLLEPVNLEKMDAFDE